MLNNLIWKHLLMALLSVIAMEKAFQKLSAHTSTAMVQKAGKMIKIFHLMNQARLKRTIFIMLRCKVNYSY